MPLQFAPRLSGAIHIRRVSDGDVRVPTLGRAQRVARRHWNWASILVSPFVDPRHVESHPVPRRIEPQRRDGARNVGVQPIVDEFQGIGFRHVAPSTSIGAMPLAMVVTTPSCRPADIGEKRAINRIVPIQLGVLGVLLTWGLVMFGALHRRRSEWDGSGSIGII
jgi:hypothetical protein